MRTSREVKDGGGGGGGDGWEEVGEVFATVLVLSEAAAYLIDI